jgi:muramoyltetrapeptide carboxypeptidase
MKNNSIKYVLSGLVFIISTVVSTAKSAPMCQDSTTKKTSPITRLLTYQLGETEVQLEHFSCPSDNGLVYFHPHENEFTSNKVAREQISRRGGDGYFLRHGGERLITFELKGEKYLVDPNRMFSLDGVRDSLKKYGNFSEEAAQEIIRFSAWVSGVISSGRVFAVHNNRNQGYNVLSYLKDNQPAQGVSAIHINPKENTGNFIYTTNAGLFSVAKANNLNTVLQSPSVVDDGSYSVFAQKHGIDYINVETQIGDGENDNRLLSFVNRYYSAPALLKPSWSVLKKGDIIDLVAPSSAYHSQHIKLIKKVFAEYGIEAREIYAKQEPTPLGYSAPAELRMNNLIKAINAPDSKAVWAVRGGAGASNLLPELLAYEPPEKQKPVIGFSDTTALHLFLNSKWNWATIHGVVAEFNAEVDQLDNNSINRDSKIKEILDVLMGKTHQLVYKNMQPLNTAAHRKSNIQAKLIGGNLTLMSTALGTNFFSYKEPFILVLEDIGNTIHQLERFLDQIAYSDFLQYGRGIILGEFFESSRDSEEQKKLTDLVLNRFANKVSRPVFRLNRFGHSKLNIPLILGTKAKISKNNNGDFTLSIDSPVE